MTHFSASKFFISWYNYETFIVFFCMRCLLTVCPFFFFLPGSIMHRFGTRRIRIIWTNVRIRINSTSAVRSRIEGPGSFRPPVIRGRGRSSASWNVFSRDVPENVKYINDYWIKNLKCIPDSGEHIDPDKENIFKIVIFFWCIK